MNNPEFIRDLRNFTSSLGLTPAACKNYLAQEFMAFPGMIVNRTGNPVELDLDVFEIDDDMIFTPSNISGSAKNISRPSLKTPYISA